MYQEFVVEKSTENVKSKKTKKRNQKVRQSKDSKKTLKGGQRN